MEHLSGVQNMLTKAAFPFDEIIREKYNKNACFETILASYVPTKEHEIVVVIPSYQNAQWYERNLSSVFKQTYTNYSVIYIDDASPDGTGNLVEAYIKKNKQEHRVTLIKNAKNQGAMANLYFAISGCNPQAIIVTLDGDDWLGKPSVLELINKIYDKYQVFITYGSFQHYPYMRNVRYFSRPVSLETYTNRSYRKIKPFPLSHLRTFRALLFQAIKKEDLMDNGEFFDVSWDVAMMTPMAEMAGDSILYVPDILYIYNVATPLSDHKLKRARQVFYGNLIRSKPVYSMLNKQDVLI
jgi:glycosyltransferase involved in cell wall biosynthesis